MSCVVLLPQAPVLGEDLWAQRAAGGPDVGVGGVGGFGV